MITIWTYNAASPLDFEDLGRNELTECALFSVPRCAWDTPDAAKAAALAAVDDDQRGLTEWQPLDVNGATCWVATETALDDDDLELLTRYVVYPIELVDD